jgi:hypothetical protein
LGQSLGFAFARNATSGGPATASSKNESDGNADQHHQNRKRQRTTAQILEEGRKQDFQFYLPSAICLAMLIQ